MNLRKRIRAALAEKRQAAAARVRESLSKTLKMLADQNVAMRIGQRTTVEFWSAEGSSFMTVREGEICEAEVVKDPERYVN